MTEKAINERSSSANETLRCPVLILMRKDKMFCQSGSGVRDLYRTKKTRA